MLKEHPLEVHSTPPKEFADVTGSRRYGRFYTRRSQHVPTLNKYIPVTKEGENPPLLPEILDAKPSELPLQVPEAISLQLSPFHAATRRRAIRSRRTNFDSIILPTGFRRLPVREMDSIRCRRARKNLTDEQLAAARAKQTIRRRNARLNQTAEQKAATRAMDTARKRAYRQRLKQAKMMIKDDNESANKPSPLSSRERATIRKRNQRLKQTAEQRADTRALETARRRAARQRLREAKMMINNDHGNTHVIQPESVDKPLTLTEG